MLANHLNRHLANCGMATFIVSQNFSLEPPNVFRFYEGPSKPQRGRKRAQGRRPMALSREDFVFNYEGSLMLRDGAASFKLIKASLYISFTVS